MAVEFNHTQSAAESRVVIAGVRPPLQVALRSSEATEDEDRCASAQVKLVRENVAALSEGNAPATLGWD